MSYMSTDVSFPFSTENQTEITFGDIMSPANKNSRGSKGSRGTYRMDGWVPGLGRGKPIMVNTSGNGANNTNNTDSSPGNSTPASSGGSAAATSTTSAKNSQLATAAKKMDVVEDISKAMVEGTSKDVIHNNIHMLSDSETEDDGSTIRALQADVAKIKKNVARMEDRQNDMERQLRKTCLLLRGPGI